MRIPFAQPLMLIAGSSSPSCLPLMFARSPAPAMVAAADLAAVVTKSFGSEGVAFFNNFRVPAALVAAAAIKDAFVMQSASEDVKKSKAWTLLRNAYLLLQMASFSSELTCVFIATHAIAALQMTSIDLTAGSLSQMLIRELEYEYVGVRTGFTTGLLAFTAAQAIRVRYALRRSRDLSWCAMWFLISAACSLLTYNNATTLTYGGYTGLLSRWTLLHSQLIFSRLGLNRPVATICVLTFCASVAVGVRITIGVFLAKADSNQDGSIDRDEWIAFFKSAPGDLLAYLTGLRPIWFKEEDPQSDLADKGAGGAAEGGAGGGEP